MTYELTQDGLFSYFDPTLVETILELSLVKRHLSVHDYLNCKEACSLFKQGLGFSPIIVANPIQAILSFHVLKQASVDELIEYFSIEKIKEAYVQCYGEYFSIFESKIMASKNRPQQDFSNAPLLFDVDHEKILILHIKAAMSLPLQVFTNSITEQDFLLQEIASLLIYQAGRAQKFITAIEDDDILYKQVVVSLAFSVLKMGLGVFNVSELINVSQSISSLAASAFNKIEQKLSGLVSDIQNLVVTTQYQVLQEAEKELLSTVAPEDIALRWVSYRGHVFHNANKSIKNLLDTCVNNDDFFRCIIRETAYKHQGATEDQLQIYATEKARLYIAEIAEGLKSQVNKIRIIRDSVLSKEGSEKIELYFRKICLINYTMSLETSTVLNQSWIPKGLGHRLTYYFPELVFQKKWAIVKFHNYIHNGVLYCKQKIPLKEYQERRRNSPVVLGLFRNSTSVKHELFARLEEQLTGLSDSLIHDLQQQKKHTPTNTVRYHEDPYDSQRTRYSFKRRQLSLFSFSELPFSPESSRSLPRAAVPPSPVVLISQRSFAGAHSQ